MRFFYLLSLLFLSIITSSCLTETAAVLAPEVPDNIVEEEESDATTNFVIDGAGLQVNNGYVLTTSLRGNAGFIHHLVLTTENLAAPLGLQGESAAFTISLFSDRQEDLSGTYKIGGDHLVPGNASMAKYYRNLNFTDNRYNGRTRLREGEITLAKQEEGYVITYLTTSERWLNEARGTFSGILHEIPMSGRGAVAEADFQGPNHLKYGESEMEINHAYLVRDGDFDSGTPRFRLYLSEQEIAPDAANLTGRSDLVFFYVGDYFYEEDGAYSFTPETRDYVSSLVKGVDKAYYCRNMNFSTNTADDDVPATKGVVQVRHTEGGVQLAFSATAVTNETVSGIYQGPVMVLD